MGKQDQETASAVFRAQRVVIIPASPVNRELPRLNPLSGPRTEPSQNSEPFLENTTCLCLQVVTQTAAVAQKLMKH